ncbi:MAG: transglutaminase domain-containing protein [Candidatus Acidiferrales bacterium]|jgi:transglutaminase-like putative cysteine protease
MKTRTAVFLSAILAFLTMAVVVSAVSVSSAGDAPPVTSRSFEFTYTVTVPALPATSAPLRVWIPLPDHDAYQKISDLRIEASVAHTVEQHAEHGNEFAVFVVNTQQATAPFDIVLSFHATRYEHRVPLATNTSLGATASGKTAPAGAPESQLMLAHWLQPDRLVPTNGVIAQLAQENTAGATDTLDKARKIYEYVVSTMRYDKTGEGWGHGDAVWACTAKRGNCTDFHSLFIGMMRASGIPARFEIGFPLPADKAAGDIPGYHCWAEFYVEGIGWIPVDASEAWKHPDKHEYFFGAHDVNRIQFTTGRDLRLDATQKGDPLNYFIYPYAELDGKPFDKLQSHFAFRDVPAAPPASAHAQAIGND